MLSTVRELNLEGVVAKRIGSIYEPDKRRVLGSNIVNQSQDFVIGGFMPGSHGLVSIILDGYRGHDLMGVARVRAGFVPALDDKCSTNLGKW